MGRPLKDIDADEVQKLAGQGCTQAEIAGHFGCAQSTISERFRSEFELGAAQSKTSLRRLQFARAEAGSDAMLIHLGKVHLGQDDKVQVAGKIEIVVKYTDVDVDVETPPPGPEASSS